MNLSNLITEAQRLAGRVDTQWNDRTRRWLNEAQEEWAISVPWPTLVRTEDFVADGTARLVLPPRVLTIQWLGDTSNYRTIDPSRHMDRESPSALFQGTSGAAVLWNEQGPQAVIRQPTVAANLLIQTTQSDSFGVYIAGLVEDTTCSGTAEQYSFSEEKLDIISDSTATSVNKFVRIEVFGKDDFTPGDVTLKQGTSLLARLAAHSYSSQYRVVELMYVPIAGTGIRVCYIQRPMPLVEIYQIPPPAVDVEYLIWYAASMIHMGQGQTQEGQLKRAHADSILQKRIYKERGHGDKDLRAMPSNDYWGHDDQYTVPENY